MPIPSRSPFQAPPTLATTCPGMRSVLGLMLAIVLGAASAAPAAAQPAPRDDGRSEWTVGWGASWFAYSPFVDAGEAGLEQPLELEDGIGGSVFAQRWYNRWLGVHVDASYHRPTLTLPTGAPSLNVWSGSLALALRPTGGTGLLAPYVFGGGGVIGYGVGGTSVVLEETDVVFSAGDTEQLYWQAGGGLDIALYRGGDGNPIAAHVQVGRVGVLDTPFGVADGSTETDYWRVTVGLSARVMP